MAASTWHWDDIPEYRTIEKSTTDGVRFKIRTCPTNDKYIQVWPSQEEAISEASIEDVEIMLLSLLTKEEVDLLKWQDGYFNNRSQKQRFGQ